MRKVNARFLPKQFDSVLLSVNRFFYVLTPKFGHEYTEIQQLKDKTLNLTIKGRVEAAGVQHFEVFPESDLFVNTDESHKIVNFYRLADILALEDKFPTPIHQYRAFKKVTDLKRAKCEQFEGLLISDRTGEIGFINVKNVHKLPKEALKIDEEEAKNKADDELNLPQWEKDEAYKTLYGH